MTIGDAVIACLDWHVGAIDADGAAAIAESAGLSDLADALRLASTEPPRAVFIFAPAPFVDLLDAYEHVVVVEAGRFVRVSTNVGGGSWVSTTYRI